MWIWNSSIALLFFALYALTARTGDECNTPNGEKAICKSIYECQSARKLILTRNESQIKFWQASQCGYEEDPLVCCGTLENYISPPTRSNPNRKLSDRTSLPNNHHFPERGSCGFLDPDIYMGNLTFIGELPWMSYLHYKNAKGFFCTGCLISSRYILTSATCVSFHVAFPDRHLEMVRIGQWNNETDPHCNSEETQKFCKRNYEEIGIESFVIHGKFGKGLNDQNDIALIKLNKDVEYTSNIRPICLPDRNEKYSFWENNVLFRGREGDKPKTTKIRRGNETSSDKTFYHILQKEIWPGEEEEIDMLDVSVAVGGPIMTASISNTNQWNLERIFPYDFMLELANMDQDNSTTYGLDVRKYLDWIFSNANK